MDYARSNSSSDGRGPSVETSGPRGTRGRHAPKVRTGCITCKIRKVKCDEGKPACLACTRTGRRCDGYRGPTAASTAAATLTATPTAATYLPAPAAAIAWIPAKSPYETRFLHMFCHHIAFVVYTVGATSGYAPLAIRFALTDHAARDATIAMAICFEAHTTGLHSSTYDLTLLTHYNKAISATGQILRMLSSRGAAAADRQAWNSLLVTAMQFIGLEMLRGRIESAAFHLGSMMGIVKGCQPGGLLLNRAYGLDTFQNLFLRMKLHLDGFPSFDMLKAPLPDKIDPVNTPLEEGPVFFRTIDEVTKLWYHLVEDFQSVLWRFEAISNPLPEDEQAVEQFQFRIRRWYNAFEYFHCTLTSNNHPYWIFPQGTIFKAHAKTMLVRLASRINGSDETRYDEFTGEFEEVLALVQSLPPAWNQKMGLFWTHTPAMAAVYYVAVKCRDPRVRRDAITWMEQWPTRRGVWDGQAMGTAVARRIVQIEEDGQNVKIASDVVEITRLRRARVKVDYLGRNVTLRYLRWANGSLQQNEEILVW